MPNLIKAGQKPGGTRQWGPGGTGEELECGQQNSGAGREHSRQSDSWGPQDEGAKTTACFERWAEQGWVWRPQKRKRNLGFGKS